jgi:hypothetical protein
MRKYKDKQDALNNISNDIKKYILTYGLSVNAKSKLDTYAIIYNMPEHTTDIKIYADGHIESNYIFRNSGTSAI